jgi:hypothetical protein
MVRNNALYQTDVTAFNQRAIETFVFEKITNSLEKVRYFCSQENRTQIPQYEGYTEVTAYTDQRWLLISPVTGRSWIRPLFILRDTAHCSVDDPWQRHNDQDLVLYSKVRSKTCQQKPRPCSSGFLGKLRDIRRTTKHKIHTLCYRPSIHPIIMPVTGKIINIKQIGVVTQSSTSCTYSYISISIQVEKQIVFMYLESTSEGYGIKLVPSIHVNGVYYQRTIMGSAQGNSELKVVCVLPYRMLPLHATWDAGSSILLYTPIGVGLIENKNGLTEPDINLSAIISPVTVMPYWADNCSTKVAQIMCNRHSEYRAFICDTKYLGSYILNMPVSGIITKIDTYDHSTQVTIRAGLFQVIIHIVSRVVTCLPNVGTNTKYRGIGNVIGYITGPFSIIVCFPKKMQALGEWVELREISRKNLEFNVQ